MRLHKTILLAVSGVASVAMLTLNVPAQDRPAPDAAERPVREAQRADQAAGEVQITLRPVGEGRFEVYINGERVEGRASERIVRAMQDRPVDPRRPGAEDAPPGERPVRQGRGPQGEGGRQAGPPAAPGMDRPESDLMPPLRQGVGQVYAGPMPELTDELLIEVLAVIADFDEVLHARLSSAMENNPEVVRGRLQNDLRRWMAAVELKRSDPELYQLNVSDRRLSHETSRLVGEYHAARRQGETEKIDSIRTSLESLVGQHFDVRQKMRERDLSQLQQRLEFLRTQIQQRREQRQEVIRQHIQQLFGGPTDEF